MNQFTTNFHKHVLQVVGAKLQNTGLLFSMSFHNNSLGNQTGVQVGHECQRNSSQLEMCFDLSEQYSSTPLRGIKLDLRSYFGFSQDTSLLRLQNKVYFK